LLVVISCRTSLTPRQNWRLAAEFSIVVLGMLLFSERTWKHHCVTILLPFAVFTYFLAVVRPGRRLRFYLIATLLTAFILMTITSTTGVLPRIDEIARMAQVYGAYVWAYLVLIVGLVVMLVKDSCQESGVSELG